VSVNIKKVISDLGSPDESDRCYAVEDLKQVNDPKVVEYLVIALKDPSTRVRETAVDILSIVGGSEVVASMVQLLDSESVPIRNAAIEVLEKLGPSALSTLEKYMDVSSVDVRKFAIDTIGKILQKSSSIQGERQPRILAVLVDRLWSLNANVAGAAAEALGLSKDDTVIEPLLEHLFGANQSSWLQCNIIVALSRIGSNPKDRQSSAL
jgi:HEAT repeat protein